MFLGYYKLLYQPFGVTPEPAFLFLSRTHREALASLCVGVRAGRGFVALIAKPGMGKTTLLVKLLQELDTSAKTVFLFQPQFSTRDFLRSLLADLGVGDSNVDLVSIQSELNKVLLRESHSGKGFVLVIDEAQNLSPSVLELLRMLSNFETRQRKLMHIVLAGQPQLAETLASPDLVQLRQRVSIIARLNAFTEEETRLYIDHRLRVAGYDFQHPLFTKRALAMIASHSKGIPRNINNICFNALSLGCALKQRTIDGNVVREVLEDLDLGALRRDAVMSTERKRTNAQLRLSTTALLSAAALFLAVVFWPVMAGQKKADVITSQRLAASEKSSIAVTPLPVLPVSTSSQIPTSANPTCETTAATSETSSRTQQVGRFRRSGVP